MPDAWVRGVLAPDASFVVLLCVLCCYFGSTSEFQTVMGSKLHSDCMTKDILDKLHMPGFLRVSSTLEKP